jgi:hypothetical protein
MADEKRAVPRSKGEALAKEYGIQFFETSAKDNLNVEEVRWAGGAARGNALWCVFSLPRFARVRQHMQPGRGGVV